MTVDLPPMPAVAARRETLPAAAGPAGDNGLWIVLGLMAGYSALHIGFRLLASWSLGEDDPLENLLVQDLRAFYDPRQPPLYDWVLYAVQTVTGPTIVSFLAIKYAALIGTGAALYAIARRAIGPGITALLAVEALALIYQLSWRFHEGYTHQVGAMVAVAATMWALLRFVDDPRALNVVILGVAGALGVLTQPVYLVFALALGLAAAAEVDVRSVVSVRRLLPALVPVIAALSFLGWQVSGIGVGSPYVPSQAPAAFSWPDLRQAFGGLVNALRAPLFYLSPLILIVPLFFRGFPARAWKDIVAVARFPAASATGDPSAPGRDERIVLRTSVIGFGLSLAGAAALGLKGYSSHVFMPLYLTSLVWIMGAVQRSTPTAPALTRFSRVALAIAVFALVARLANMFVLDPVCKICRWGIPYEGLAAELSGVGAAPGIVIASDRELGGNLRAVLPSATVAVPGSRLAQNLSSGGVPRQVVAVWPADMADQAVERMFGPHLEAGQTIASAVTVQVPWRHLWRPEGYRHSVWKYLVIKRAG